MKNTVIGITAGLALLLVVAGVFAFGPHGFGNNSDVTAAIKANDYNAFEAALAAHNVTKNVTQDQFNTLVSRYQKMAPRMQAMTDAQTAIKNNDFTAWSTAMGTVAKDQSKITQANFDLLVQEYQTRQKVDAAVTANDYNAWKSAMTDGLTQERFNVLVAHHQNVQNGTGMPPHGPHGHMMGRIGGMGW